MFNKTKLGAMLTAVMLATTMTTILIPVTASAAIVDSGSCGENVTWTLDDVGTLTISGEGAIVTHAFNNNNNSNIKSVVIENGVTSIGSSAFFGCSSLTSITIPDSVTSIGERAFYNTAYYEDMHNWKNDVLYINNHLIKAKTTITEVNIKEDARTVADLAFSDCISLTNVTIPDSVTSIGEAAFEYCSGLTSLTIGNGVTNIGERAFSGCKGLTSVTIPDSVTSIGERAFYACSGLTSVTIGNGVTSIGKSAFYSCKGLTSVTIPDSVTSIGEAAFEYCSGLTNLTIPDSVTSIGERAFFSCSGLTGLTIAAYDDTGMKPITAGEKTLSGNEASFTAELPDANYKIFLWDKSQVPLIKAVYVE